MRTGHFWDFTESSATKHVCPWNGRTQRRPQFATRITCTVEVPHAKYHYLLRILLIHRLTNTQAFAEDQIKVTREHARTRTSAAIVVPMFRGIAILPIVTHLSLSTPLTTTPHPLLPLSFEAAIPIALHRLPRPRNYHVCQGLFSFALAHQCWPTGQPASR